MNCPKCNNEINDKATICPHCKKVLKLECPICNTLNEKNVCKKCGFTIITKCHKCSKIIKTISEKCPNCSFSTYKSVAINSSEIDEFACIIFDFPNLSDVKAALKSTKLYEKFKLNLDNQIATFAHKLGLHREVINQNYVIKFNKDESFERSALNAIKSAIELQNQITELNFKLNKSKGMALESRITILKKNIESLPKDYQSNFDIKLIYQNKKEEKLLNALQIITDAKIYEQSCDKYNLQSLSTVQVQGEMMMFFELKLKKYIKIPHDIIEEEEDLSVKLPKFEENENDSDKQINDIYDIDGINFEELKSEFLSLQVNTAILESVKRLASNAKKIIAIKSNDEIVIPSAEFITAFEKTNKFERIFRVTCNDNMKLQPWGFFKELICGTYNYTPAVKYLVQNDFSAFAKDNKLKKIMADFINYKYSEEINPEETRNQLCDLFLNFIYSMNNSLIFIENFEKIDDSSRELLELVFEKINDINAGFLISGDKISLHRTTHSLLSSSKYAEINVKPEPFASIIEPKIKMLSEILETEYIKKISQNTKGRPLYFKHALEYLMEADVLEKNESKLQIKEEKNILIPPALDVLISKRLKLLSKDKDAYQLLACIILLNSRVDFNTIEKLEIKDDVKALKKLTKSGLLYAYNNSIYVANAEILRTALIKFETPEKLKELCEYIIKKLFTKIPESIIEYELYKLIENKVLCFKALEHICKQNYQLGDFNSYLNSSLELLSLMNEIAEENIENTREEYKTMIYTNLSELLYNYTPEKLQNISHLILENIEKTSNSQKVAMLCSRILQGCMLAGNYNTALSLLLKMTARLKDVSYNPHSQNFNLSYFFISLMKVEILFGLGELKDCVALAEDLLKNIDLNLLSTLSQIPQEYIKGIITDTMSLVAFAKILMLQDDTDAFFETLETKISQTLECKALFITLNKIIRGFDVPEELDEHQYQNKLSKLLCNLINASIYKGNYEKFAKLIYQAKVISKINKFHQIELICDLLIGYSYFKMDEYKKAQYIYDSVMENSTKNGLKNVTYFAWLLVSILKINEGDIEVAFGIASNASIKLEQDSNSSDLLILGFKTLLAKVAELKNDEKMNNIFSSQAEMIKNKYGIQTTLEV